MTDPCSMGDLQDPIDGGTAPYKGIFSRDIPLHRPYIGLIYGRYLQFRFLKWSFNPWRIHGAAIYGVPWIPSIYPSHVSIYTSTMDPSWVKSGSGDRNFSKQNPQSIPQSIPQSSPWIEKYEPSHGRFLDDDPWGSPNLGHLRIDGGWVPSGYLT